MKIRSFLLPLAASLSLVQVGFAFPITNQIKGVGPEDKMISPYICIQDSNENVLTPLAYNETADGNQLSGNSYYIGMTLRFGGCSKDNTYLGYLDINTNPLDKQRPYFMSPSAYQPPKGIHIKYVNGAIDDKGNMTGQIQYTPINANFNFPSPQKQNESWDFVGINLSGLEFGKVIDPVVVPNLSKEDADGNSSDLNEVQQFIAAGINTIRVPISWSYLQLDGPGKGELNLDYFNSYVKPLLETLTVARVNTIVDLHAYMRYSTFGQEYSGCMKGVPECPGGKLILDANVYQDVWTKLYKLIKNDPKINMNYILFDLMNEPVGVPNDSVFTIQAQLIKSLRQNGFQGYILVEGNSWSGLHSWTDFSWKSDDGKTVYTNATLFSRENFVKAGITDLDKILINAHQYLDSDYSGTHDVCETNLGTTGTGGFNLKAFRDYLEQNHLKAIVAEFGGGIESGSCSTALTQFLDYLKENSSKKHKDYGFVGWTIWSVGHGWGNYNLRVTPTSYQMNVMKPYL